MYVVFNYCILLLYIIYTYILICVHYIIIVVSLMKSKYIKYIIVILLISTQMSDNYKENKQFSSIQVLVHCTNNYTFN